MKNLGQMLKQAQQMQEKMGEMQSALEQAEVDGEAGGGMVRVTLNGRGDMKAVKIDPAIFSAEEAEMIEDPIVAAHNDARARAQERMQEEMAKMTGGLQLPEGFKLPF